ncbi:MAG: STAS-like domain-containing protein [Elusimicrobiota bacterium]
MADTNELHPRLNILDLCGPNALNVSDGKKIHRLILNRWGMAETVEVDLAGAAVSRAFLDEAVGQLVMQFEKADIIAKLKVTGLSAQDKLTLNSVVVSRYQARGKARRDSKFPG